MGALSPYSRIFTDTRNELIAGVQSGELATNEQRRNFIRSKGIKVEDYQDAFKEYKSIESRSKKSKEELEKPGYLIPRVALGALGKVGEGVENISEAVAPEFTQKAREFAQENIPESLERKRQKYFFPTQGEGEQTASEIGSYFVPGTVIVKGLNLGAKGLKLAQGAKALGLGKKAAKTGEVIKYGTGFAAGATVIEKPEDNIINIISEMTVPDEEGKPLGTAAQLIKKLEINPNDSKSSQYLQSFLNNLMFEGVLAGPTLAAAKSLSKLPGKEFAKKITKKGVEYVVPTPLKRWSKEWLTARRGLNDRGLAILAEREGAVKASLTKAEILESQLRAAIEKTYPKKRRTKKDMENINAALAGDRFALRKLKLEAPDIGNHIDDMRAEIDKLSLYVKDHIAKGDLSVTIGENLETYLNRSYQIYDDPENYKHFLKSKEGEKAIESAKEYFRKEGVDEEDLSKVLEYYTKGVTKGEFNSFLKNVKPRTSQILKQKKDIAPAIRHLWGETTDPLKNYVNSFTKLANLKSEYQFLKQITNEAEKSGKAFRTKPGDTFKDLVQYESDELLEKSALKSLGGTSSKNVKSPLQDLYLDPSWKKAIDEGLEVAMPGGPLMRHWMKMKAGSQAMKTIYSVPTHGRNIMGNTFIMLANGTIDPRFWGKGIKDIWKRFKGKLSPEESERLARYQELGILDSSVHVSSLRKAASEAFTSGPDGFVEKIAKRTGATGRGIKKVSDTMVKAYEAEDNLFKIANFEQQMKAFRKVLPDMSQRELERFVAQRTRDTMPNYNMVPKAFKALRAAPIGNFLAFPAEMIRNSYHLAKYTWKDISGQTARELRDQAKKQKINIGKINEGALKALGFKRLAGMTAAATAGDAMVEVSKQMMGIDDDQEAALNQIVPEWEKGTNKIFVSPIEKNKKGEIQVDYLNLGPIDPYSYLKTPTKMVAAAILNNEDYNEQAVRDDMSQAFRGLLSPFGDPSMVVQGMLDVYRGKGVDPDQSLASGITDSIIKSFTPGTLDFFMNRYTYEKGKDKFGEGVTKFGFPIIEGQVDAAAFLGVKRQRANLSKGLNFNIKSPIRDMNNSKRLFTNEITNYLGGDPNKILNKYKESQANKMKHAQRLRTLAKSYRALGMDESDMYMALSKNGLLTPKNLDEFMKADQNFFVADQIPKTAMTLGEMETGADIPYEEIFDIYNTLTGSEID